MILPFLSRILWSVPYSMKCFLSSDLFPTPEYAPYFMIRSVPFSKNCFLCCKMLHILWLFTILSSSIWWSGAYFVLCTWYPILWSSCLSLFFYLCPMLWYVPCFMICSLTYKYSTISALLYDMSPILILWIFLYSKKCFLFCDLLPLYPYSMTSGFWPRVRARALRAPVFLGSLPRPTGRCAPPAHRSFAAPQK